MASKSAWLAVLIIAIIIIAIAPEPIINDTNQRTVIDLPIPANPPCPEGSECAMAHACDPLIPYLPPILNEEWNSNGSFRIFSSPNLIDLNKDGTLDIVNGMGIEEEENKANV